MCGHVIHGRLFSFREVAVKSCLGKKKTKKSSRGREKAMAGTDFQQKLALLEPAVEDICNLIKIDEYCENTVSKETHIPPKENIEVIVDMVDITESLAQDKTDALSPAAIPAIIFPVCKIGEDSPKSFAKMGAFSAESPASFAKKGELRNDKEASSTSSCQSNITGFEAGYLHKLASEVESLEKGWDLSRDHVKVVEEKTQMHTLKGAERYDRINQFLEENDPSEKDDIYCPSSASFQKMSEEYPLEDKEMEDTGQTEKQAEMKFSHYILQSQKLKANGGELYQNCSVAETSQLGFTGVPRRRGRGRPRKMENRVPAEGIFEDEEMGVMGQNENEKRESFSYSSLQALKRKENGGVSQKCTELPRKRSRGRPRKVENIFLTDGICKQATYSIDKLLKDDTSAIDKPLKENLSLSQVPTSSTKLLSTGLLEGYSVQYFYRNETLYGTIVEEGILCQCRTCKGKKVVNLTSFEKHAGSVAKRPSDYICFENGTSFTQLVRLVSNAPLHKIPDVIKSTLGIVSTKSIHSNGQSEEYANFSSQLQLHQAPLKCDLGSSTHKTIQERAIAKGRTSLSKLRESDDQWDHVKKRKRGRPPSTILGSMSDRPKRARETSLHKLIFMPGSGIPKGTLLSYYIKGQHFLDGFKQDFGILCGCCNEVVSCSLFEAHAGWGSRKSPYKHIYLSDGRTLHEVALSIANETRISEKESPNCNEDFCAICGDGGLLLCCDGCPKAYHKECLGIRHEPVSRYWFCRSNRGCSLTGENISEKGSYKVSRKVGHTALRGRPPKRVSRVVNKAADSNYNGCVLCRHEEFTKYGFDDRTILFCDQCEKEFHVGCLRYHGIADLKELPNGNWFCSNDCSEIHEGLQKHVAFGSQCLPRLLSESLVKKVENDVNQGLQDEIKWQILHGKTTDIDGKDLLLEAEAIFHDRFESIVDPSTGRDLIPLMLYSKSMRDRDFGGMYSAVLTINSEVVSAAVFRVFGKQIAELPLVATRANNEGQGYFQALFSCIEEVFCSLNIKHIVLPAAEEAESFWINKIGFLKMSIDQFNERSKDVQVMAFKGASMLEKELAQISKNGENR
ncbi:uncharacterized protein LOC131075351 isoform X1 [Cryptomeria japonica]|uniref:uncharacterized protein LOC131075351 isoform X1 n=2 Tax=Cryptomeria japonica TaxID=3369 RepID=UPI0027DA9C4E|nr:uncharacterized protein LOC131075351 isoform X1 [Cryptomeria japonica]XP_057868152.2 uncharacterized protein LOC131075351 isoform X1 [Cryptomeria japonica]XP_059072612.1 uncharacterized protein LOC131075351 isoform X1 [Cryptomeria japonica]